jgi:hypothetical protein
MGKSMNQESPHGFVTLLNLALSQSRHELLVTALQYLRVGRHYAGLPVKTSLPPSASSVFMKFFIDNLPVCIVIFGGH